jgi:hypothetical protein
MRFWADRATDPTITPTPTSVPTPTTSLPSGEQLLAIMRQLLRKAGSVRYLTTVLSVTKKERVTATTHADISWRHNRLREHDLTKRIMLARQPVGGTIERRTLLFAHQMAASRSSLNRRWYCEPLSGVRVGKSFLPFQVGAPPATNLGLTTMNGSTVWHVQARGVMVYTWGLHAATADFYIAQGDHTLRELDIRGTARLAGKTERDSIDERYSRYGEPVRVTLPAACQAVNRHG